MTNLTLEAEAASKKRNLLDILPRSMVKTGDELSRAGAKFRPDRDDKGNETWCAELEGEHWERVTHDGPMQNHKYFLRATSCQRLQASGFVGTEGYYHKHFDGKVVFYTCKGQSAEYESSEDWPFKFKEDGAPKSDN